MERGATALTIKRTRLALFGLGRVRETRGWGTGRTRSLGPGEMWRRLKPLLVFFFSYLSTPTPIPYYLLLAIPSHPTLPIPLSPPKTARNPREIRIGHTLKFPSDQIPTGASHTCDRHAANLLRFVHGLIGFRDGGFHLDISRRYMYGGIQYYTILYPIPTPTLKSQLTRMFDVEGI